MNERRLAFGICLLLLMGYVWHLLRIRDVRTDNGINTITLPPNDKEKLIINEHTHTITEVKRNAQTKKIEVVRHYTGPVTGVEEQTDGTIKITTRKWGTELSPSVGILYGSDTTLRAAGTLELFYYERFGIGVGLGMGAQLNSARALVFASYNCYGNMNTGIYVDNQKHAGVIATLRFN